MRSPETQELYDIFNGRIQYVVPIYQRAYVWSEEENWAPLWDAIEDAADRYLEDPGAQGHATHFLGAIVLEQLHSEPGGVDRRIVIDGQQRLTTLQAIFVAASEVATEVGADDTANELSELTLNQARAATGDLRFKVWPSKRNRVEFKSVIDPELSAAENGRGIRGAFSFFKARFREWLNEEEQGGPTPQQRVEALRVCLDSLLYVVSINLDESDNAQVIFETLNATGTDLTALELSKNALFLQAERETPDGVDALHEESWEPTFEKEGDDYWEAEVRQGRLRRARSDLFLMHWLNMRLAPPKGVRATQLFETLRRDVLRGDEAPTMTEFIPELCADAQIMRSFDDFEAGTPEALFFERLSAIDTTTLLPLALLLFRSEEITTERRRRALAVLESWLVRRAILRYTSKNYNGVLASLLGRVKADLSAADDVIFEELRSADAATTLWPGDEEVRERLEHKEVYNYISRDKLRMLLEAVERDVRDPSKTEPIHVPAGLSIEHALPQEWESHWPVDVNAPDLEAATEARSAHVHRLGNLTLVTQPLNSSLSNAPWDQKRAELKKRSVLLLNQHLCDEGSWTEDDIDLRGRDFADRIIRTWPGAQSDHWNAMQAS